MGKKQNKFSFNQRLISFKYAYNGLKTLFKEEHNARVHLFVSIIVIVLGLFFKISFVEWIAIFLVIGLVFICEIFNSAIENICDKISTDYDSLIKKIKDYGSLATLVSSIVAVIIGIFIFLPKLFSLLS